MDRWMPPSIFGARPCAAAPDGAWELLLDVDESRITDQDLTILTLDHQKQCFGRLDLQSLREPGSRLGMPRLALKALEAYAQLQRDLFLDGQPTSMLIRGGELRGVPQGCALSVQFCNLGGWAWSVCMKRELPHVRTNAYLDDRLMCAGSCDSLPGALGITKQVDDYFGAVLNCKRVLGPRQKLPSRHRRKLCALIDYTRSLVYLGVDVLMRGASRSVASSLLMRWLPCGWLEARRSPGQTHVIKVGWSFERFGVQALWQTCSFCGTPFLVQVCTGRSRLPAYIYTFCLQFIRMIAM